LPQHGWPQSCRSGQREHSFKRRLGEKNVDGGITRGYIDSDSFVGFGPVMRRLPAASKVGS
jgi:hypothetical protein